MGERDQLEAAVFVGFLNPGTRTPQQTQAQSSKDLFLTLLCQTLCPTFQGPVSVYTDDIFGGFSWTDCEIQGLITIKLLDPERQIHPRASLIKRVRQVILMTPKRSLV